MKRKGISPLIAAVLLIAFTMAIASIFAQWAPQLIQSAQGDTQNTSEELQKCSGVTLDVRERVSNSTSVTVQQTAGEEGVGSLSTTFIYDEGPAQPSGSSSIDDPRGTAQISLSSSDLPSGLSMSGVSDSFSEVTVSPLNCEGTAPATYAP